MQVSADSRDIVESNNNIAYDNSTNSSFTVGNNEGPVERLRLEGNLFGGGGYTVRCDGRGQYPMTDIVVMNNRIARGFSGYTAFEGKCSPSLIGNILLNGRTKSN